jgi:AraC-like DNA-binding protein
LEKFIKDKYSSVEELEEDIKNLTQRFEEALELPWSRKQIARFLNLLEAYTQENNIAY